MPLPRVDLQGALLGKGLWNHSRQSRSWGPCGWGLGTTHLWCVDLNSVQKWGQLYLTFFKSTTAFPEGCWDLEAIIRVYFWHCPHAQCPCGFGLWVASGAGEGQPALPSDAGKPNGGAQGGVSHVQPSPRVPSCGGSKEPTAFCERPFMVFQGERALYP